MEPEDANGRLGLSTFCPNTEYFISQSILPELNITEVENRCIYVDLKCNVRIVS